MPKPSSFFGSFIETEAIECEESDDSAAGEGNSFFSEDAPSYSHDINESNSSFAHHRNLRNDITLSDVDDEGEMDSFIVPDSEGEGDESDSFATANGSPVQVGDSPPRRRVQPQRFAKHDLNTPTRRKLYEPVDSLERVKEHIYTDKENAPILGTPGSKGRAILSSLETDEQRKILLELYPELNDADDQMDFKDVTPLRPCQKTFNAHLSALEESMEMCAVTPKREIKQEQLSPKCGEDVFTTGELPIISCKNVTPRRRPKKRQVLTSPDVKKESLDDTGYQLEIVYGEHPVKEEPVDEHKHEAVVLEKDEEAEGRNSRLSDGASDDSFEKYLKSLRSGPATVTSTSESDEEGNASQSSDSDRVVDDNSFVVDDDKVLFDDSDSCSENSEEVHDESDFFSPSEGEDEEDNSDDDDGRRSGPANRPRSSEPKSKSSKKKQHRQRKHENDDDYFLDSLSPSFSHSRHPSAVPFLSKGIKGKAVRDDLTHTLFLMFKIRCFQSNTAMLDACTVSWNPRLRKTAGMCRNSLHRPTGRKSARIELSTKVLTTPDRLRDTLVHEMCHAATWLIDGLAKAGHGPAWKRWAHQCLSNCPSLPHIERCHDYVIEAKYVYECPCGQLVKRHSKSLKTDRIVCGRCRGKFVLRQPAGSRGKEGADGQTNTANKFALFVKENYGTHKKNGTTHKEVMSLLSAQWKSSQAERKLKEKQPKEEEEEERQDEGELDMSMLSIHG